MFNAKSRPVPSKGALKVLYQLAYISSGAAVGVATLCAEERRRRTKLVQKIADNAKRIRQSPRYHSNAAVAQVDVEHHFFSTAGNDRSSEYPASVDSIVRRRPRREPELPSVVEKGYERKQRKGVRRKGDGRNAQDRAGEGEAGRKTAASRTSAKTLERRAEPSWITANGKASNGTKSRAADSMLLGFDRLQQAAIRRQSDIEIRKQPTTRIRPSQKRDGDSGPRELHGFRTTSAWTIAPGTEIDFISSDISHDVQLFLRLSSLRSQPYTQWTSIADGLLRVAGSIGSSGDIKPILLWKARKNALNDGDIRDLTLSIGARRDYMGLKELITLYSSLFSRPEFCESDPSRKASLAISMMVNIIRADRDSTTKDALSTILHAVINTESKGSTTTLNETNYRSGPPKQSGKEITEHVCFQLVSSCRSLMNDGDIRHAADLLLAFNGQADSVSRETRSILLEETFEALLTRGDLHSCARLLPTAFDLLDRSEASIYSDRFLVACEENNRHKVIWKTLRGMKKASDHDIFDLSSGRSNQIIALACVKETEGYAASDGEHVQTIFEQYYRRTPPDLRGRLMENRTTLKLKALWRTTHNLDLVEGEYKKQLDWLNTLDDPSAVRRLMTALLEIRISANNIPLAMSILALLRESHTNDASLFSLSALLFARKGAWESVDKILDDAAQASYKIGAGSPKYLNQVLRSFAQEHSAEETLTFVKRLVNVHGLPPGQSTTRIMLRSFVTQKRPELISTWFIYLRGIEDGPKTDLVNTSLALDVLQQYYRDHRPSHVLLMWLCRNLTNFAPSIRGSKLTEWVESVVRKDLRHHGKGKIQYKWRQEATRQRLRLLADADDGLIPSPGYLWNGKVYWQHPQGSVEQQQLSEVQLASKTVERMPAESQPAQPNSDDQKDLTPSKVDAFEHTVGFQDLRRAYSTEQEGSADIQDYVLPISEHVAAGRHSLERAMLDAYTLKNYSEVLRLYNTSRDATGLPSSPLALEIAVESSLRMHDGNAAEAKAILATAQDAGMNTACAMGPMLIHQISHVRLTDHNVKVLGKMVTEYYRMNEEHGLPVNHHVGISVANRFISSGHAAVGLRVLNTIFKSEWSARLPLDITAMDIFLKGYAALGQESGVHWVVNTILLQNIRIDDVFMKSMTQAKKTLMLQCKEQTSGVSDEEMTRLGARMSNWRTQLCDLRHQQMSESQIAGRKIVLSLARAAAGTRLARRKSSHSLRMNKQFVSRRPAFARGNLLSKAKPHGPVAHSQSPPRNDSSQVDDPVSSKDVPVKFSSPASNNEGKSVIYQPSAGLGNTASTRMDQSSGSASYWHSSDVSTSSVYVC